MIKGSPESLFHGLKKNSGRWEVYNHTMKHQKSYYKMFKELSTLEEWEMKRKTKILALTRRGQNRSEIS